jgi:hypothetical protein
MDFMHSFLSAVCSCSVCVSSFQSRHVLGFGFEFRFLVPSSIDGSRQDERHFGGDTRTQGSLQRWTIIGSSEGHNIAGMIRPGPLPVMVAWQITVSTLASLACQRRSLSTSTLHAVFRQKYCQCANTEPHA